MGRLLSAYVDASYDVIQPISGLFRELSQLNCVLTLEKSEDIWNQGHLASFPAWPWDVPTPCSEPPAWRSKPYSTTICVFFLLGEMFSIINHVVPAFPQPLPWKGDPELVFRPGLTVGKSTGSHGREARRSSQGLCKVRAAARAHLLRLKKKRPTVRWWYHFPGWGDSSKPSYRFLWQ